MKILIVGPGCKNCKTLEAHVFEAMKKMNCSCDVEKISEMSEILAAGVLKTPGLIVDGEIQSQGQVLSSEQVEEILRKLC